MLPAAQKQDGAIPCTAIPPGDIYETQFANGQRNIFRQSWQKRADISLVKITPITERISLKYTFEVYNLTNHPSFDIPIDDVTQNAVVQRNARFDHATKRRALGGNVRTRQPISRWIFL